MEILYGTWHWSISGFLIGVTIYLFNINAVAEIPFFILFLIFYVIHQWTEISSWLKILPLRKVVED